MIAQAPEYNLYWYKTKDNIGKYKHVVSYGLSHNVYHQYCNALTDFMTSLVHASEGDGHLDDHIVEVDILDREEP